MIVRDPLDERAHVVLAARVHLHVCPVTQVGADHGRAFASEQLDARLADARRRTGDDRDLARKPAHAPLIATALRC